MLSLAASLAHHTLELPHSSTSSILNNNGSQALRILHINRLDVAVKLLLRALLIISLSRYSDSQSVWHALDPGFPDLLIELGVEADVFGALFSPKHQHQ